MRFQGKVALITGAGSGFGEVIARKFVSEGGRVVIAEMSAVAGDRVASDLGAAARFVRTDVTDDTQFEAAIRTATSSFGRLDVLVNNAGVSHDLKPFEQISCAEFDRVFAVNVRAIMRGSALAMPALKAAGGGAVINICSVGGVRIRPNLAAYNVSKAAAIAMTKALALEMAAHKIRVCGINPTLAETGLTNTFVGAEFDDAKKRAFESGVPLGRMATADDVANAVLFLASDDAGMTTGSCIDVDGGRGL
ncbi:SDR family oxidoreductase [Variovorax paradoxus]|nr:SDR family oxidoreductase [Variovorax paradoxus]